MGVSDTTEKDWDEHYKEENIKTILTFYLQIDSANSCDMQIKEELEQFELDRRNNLKNCLTKEEYKYAKGQL